ncbi:hypothetical protein TTHERM_000248218 (macronuclear) [Tetrahymena thermophila SB210]|uniref:Uncharacterized protein n=1 Tax=Tetrahymena thermophila (strain SB210) TaxID=312017 RepID=W7X6S7_TETTS|nr:hypothetical protein TTHERM_000248218 [Tetrahymena thermophila SB210]EWS72088.1 hypothetical protein TTHERM_000248218 [Tetrahymena thermophila SB210]|eukprot:XP_012655399.1 hypothetical protein TTHERM_000248218 [Tetrahymena thermophila SB210]
MIKTKQIIKLYMMNKLTILPIFCIFHQTNAQIVKKFKVIKIYLTLNNLQMDLKVIKAKMIMETKAQKNHISKIFKSKKLHFKNRKFQTKAVLRQAHLIQKIIRNYNMKLTKFQRTMKKPATMTKLVLLQNQKLVNFNLNLTAKVKKKYLSKMYKTGQQIKLVKIICFFFQQVKISPIPQLKMIFNLNQKNFTVIKTQINLIIQTKTLKYKSTKINQLYLIQMIYYSLMNKEIISKLMMKIKIQKQNQVNIYFIQEFTCLSNNSYQIQIKNQIFISLKINIQIKAKKNMCPKKPYKTI